MHYLKEDVEWYGRASFVKYTYVALLKAAIRCVFAIYGLFIFMVYWAEAYSEPCQISKMILFAKIVSQ